MAVHLAMSDDGLDGGSPPELLLDLAVNAALLARSEDLVWLWRIVAPVALVDIGALDLATGQRLGLLDHLPQGVAVIRIAGERLGMEVELAALVPFVGVGERDPGSSPGQALVAEPLRRSDLAYSNAFGLGGVPGIELPAVLALLLAADLRGTAERHGEDLLELLVILDLAPEIADDPAQAGGRNLISRFMRLSCLAWAWRPAIITDRPARRASDWRSGTWCSLASLPSCPIAVSRSLASVGKATFFGCTVVSTVRRARSLMRRRMPEEFLAGEVLEIEVVHPVQEPRLHRQDPAQRPYLSG